MYDEGSNTSNKPATTTEPLSVYNDWDVINKMASGDTAFMINEQHFSVPTLEDFYSQDLSPEVASKIQDSLSSTASNQGPLFYVETPYSTNTGYYDEAKVLIVRADPIHPTRGSEVNRRKGQRAYSLNEFDGDTLYFAIDSIEDGNQPVQVGDSVYSNLREFVRGNVSLKEANNGRFGLRFLGVNSPEIPHYTIIPSTDVEIIEAEYGKAKLEPTIYIIDKSKARQSDSAKIPFVKFGNTWNELCNKDYFDDELKASIEQAVQDRPDKESEIRAVKYYQVLVSDDSVDYENSQKGLKAQMELKNLISRAEDLILMIDQKTLNRKSGEYPTGEYEDDFFANPWNLLLHPWSSIKQIWESVFGLAGYKYLGFNMFGQDAYKRFLGTLFVKIKIPELGDMSYWVNASKYLLNTVDQAYEVLPDYTSNPLKNKNYDFAADAFKLWTYDTKGVKIIDSLKEISKGDFDDRRRIQKELGYNFENLADWTMMVGDCLFMVPPTSIRCVTQTVSEKVPLLRSRNSMVKSAPKSERLIEMTLYFNNDEGINGKPYIATLPNGEKIQYYMNGLRTLISLFKLTPFLPIENHYINNVLNIEAVSLVNLQVSTMVGYPRCIAAVLTLQEFNYHMYMPEIPIPDLTDEAAYETNLFARTINYETMRWYYQKPILLGETIKNYEFNSQEYIESTFGHKTALQPMNFASSDVEFYAADKEYLDQLLQVKLEAMGKPIKTQNTITDQMRGWAKELAYLYDTINGLDNNPDWTRSLRFFDGIDSKNIEPRLAINNSMLYNFAGSVYTRYDISHAFSDTPANRVNEALYVKIDPETKKLVIGGRDVINQYLDPLYDTLWGIVNGYADDLKMSESITMEDFTENGVNVTWKIDIGVRSSMIPDAINKQNFLKIITGELSGENIATNQFFDIDNDRVHLIMKAKFENVNNDYAWVVDSFTLDKDCPGFKFLQLCALHYGFTTADDGDYEEAASDVTSAVMQDVLSEQKEAIDFEQVSSMKFVKYPIGDVKIKNISCVFGNTFTRMSLKALDGYAPQYCGGQDTIVEITMETTDENSARMINLLPRMAAQYVRDYRFVLNCWPLRINSEITRLLGVNEVLVESVDLSTVPGQPGLYTINMRLMSVDRTARNKESLSKLDTPNNAGSKTNTTTGTVTTKNFFDLKSTLAKAEIYPDLELPTLKELEFYGFKFIRYMNREGFRLYPDPDFYFVYAHILGNEIFKNAILKLTGEGSSSKTKFKLSDMYSASFDIKPDASEVFAIVPGSENAQAKSISDQQVAIRKKVDEYVARKNALDPTKKEDKVDDADIINIYSSMDVYQAWDVSESIKCMFREKKYLKVMGDENRLFVEKLQAKSDAIIKVIDEELNLPIQRLINNDIVNWNSRNYIQSINDNNQVSKLKSAITEVVKEFIANPKIKDILTILGVPLYKSASAGQYNNNNPAPNEKVISGNTIQDALIKMILAAADATSGETTYNNVDKRTDWQARMYRNAEGVAFGVLMHKVENSLADQDALLTPYCMVEVSRQGDTGVRLATNLEDAMNHGISFGPFQIKWFRKGELEAIENNEYISTDESRLFLDPYYRKLQIEHGEDSEELKQYKRCIMMDPEVASIAFLRNILFWVKKMLQDGILLSIYEAVQEESLSVISGDTNRAVSAFSYGSSYVDPAMIQALNEDSDNQDKLKQEEEDITKNMTKEEKEEYEKLKKEFGEAEAKQQQANKLLADEIEKVITANKGPLALGKFFSAILMCITSGSQNIYTLMEDRNYNVLNQIVRGSQLPNSDSEYMTLKKFVSALVGRDIIKSLESIGTGSETAPELLGTIINERVYLKAADDPAWYIRDSFFDMIVNDKRGRMLRAFPTYYMMFIDEGREIGLWKLHDNFYNMSAIGEIQVTKSRKIAADTARIVMTNMFNTYTTDDEDAKEMGENDEYLKQYQYTWKDVFNSVFSPRTYFMQEELKRLETLPIEKAQLKPGVRIHLRMGYGSDASELPILFNGVVAEIGTGEVIELICQGDGVELTNPILSTSDAEDIQHADNFILGSVFQNWLTKGATPRTILGSLLTTKGGWMKKAINSLTNGRFFNQNPYGIVHFGDPEYKDIFQGGECVQNIYEASQMPSFGTRFIKDYLASYYSMNDVPRLSAHVFGKSYWDLMHICAGAAPDFICSTVPFGLRSSIFYGMPRYYYAYDYIKDIQPNGQTLIKEKRKPFQQYHIYTSYSDIIGNNIRASSRDVKTCAVGLYQRQGAFGTENMGRVGPMWVDFNIYPENQKTMTVDTQFLAKGVPVLGDIIPFLNKIIDDTGFTKNGYEIAWRITARALKDSIKDMYQGELVVIGDPTVKPYDKMWIEDMYESMQGCCEVEAVVHNFNTQDGYTTSIFADCISTIDDRHEQITQNWANSVVGMATAAYGGIALTSYLFAARSRPFLTSVAKWIEKGGNMATDALNSIRGLLGADEVLKNEKFISRVEGAAKWFGVNVSYMKYEKLVKNIKNYEKLVKEIDSSNVKSISDVVNAYEQVAKAYDDINPDQIIKELEAAQETLSGAKKSSVQKTITELKKVSETIKAKIKANPMDIKKMSKDLTSILEKARAASASGSGGKALEAAIKNMDEILAGANQLDNVDDIKKFSSALKVIGNNVDDVADIIKAGNIARVTVDSLKSAKKALKVADTVKDSLDAAGDITKGIKAAFVSTKAALAGTVVGIILEEAISVVLTALVYESIERWMKNLQVLKIFPLKKNGKVLTAGLNGQQGVVVGAPVYENDTTVTGIIGDILRVGEDKSTLSNVLTSVFASQDMLEIAARFRRNNNVPDPDTSVGLEHLIQAQLKNIAADELKRQSGGYNSGLMFDRVTDLQSDKGKELYKRYSIKDTSSLLINPDLKENMVALQCSKAFKNAIGSGQIQLIHQKEGDTILNFNLEGELVVVNGMTMKDKNNKAILDKRTGMPIIDLPFVRPDLYYLLAEIYDRMLLDNMPLIIHSALRAGENTWNSTGYVCRIETKNFDLGKLLEELQKEKTGFFTAVKVKDNMYDILVYPTEEVLTFQPEPEKDSGDHLYSGDPLGGLNA